MAYSIDSGSISIERFLGRDIKTSELGVVERRRRSGRPWVGIGQCQRAEKRKRHQGGFDKHDVVGRRGTGYR